MTDSPAPILPTDAAELGFESQATQQLRDGFAWLRFDQPLEREFRAAYREQIRGQMRINLWLMVALMAGVFGVSHFALNTEVNVGLDLWRGLALAPMLLTGLVLTYTRHYQRWFSALVQVLAPVFGTTVVLETLIAAQQGVSVFAALVLVVIGLYLVVGMLFYAAVRTALIVLASYCIGAPLLGLERDPFIYNLTMLLAANIIGATVCYALERVHRTNYLEARLLTEMACRDGLTGIYNRRMLDEYLDRVWQQAGRDRVFVAMMLVDIDHFKSFNDHYGHQAGDECLRLVAKTLTNCARRPLDFTARYGGEEFAVVLYDARREYVEELARQVHASVQALALEHAASPVSKVVTVSVGCAWVLPRTERSHYGFVQLADEALYAAKGAGRNRVIIVDKEYEALSTGNFRARKSAVAGMKS